MYELDGLTPDAIRSLVAPELRTVTVPAEAIEWRGSGSGDSSRLFTGYAAVCGQRTTIYCGKYYQLDEIIAPGAFDEVLSQDPDVHFNMGHDMNKSMARTKAPGPLSKLELSMDAHGLRTFARLNPENRTVQELIPLMDDGVMDEMSFAFRMGKTSEITETDENGRETVLLTIETVAELIDVCVCARGAYSTTEAALRSLALSGMGAHVANREVTRTTEGAQDNPAVPVQTTGAQDDPAVARSRELLIAEGSVAQSRFREKGDLEWTPE